MCQASFSVILIPARLCAECDRESWSCPCRRARECSKSASATRALPGGQPWFSQPLPKAAPAAAVPAPATQAAPAAAASCSDAIIHVTIDGKTRHVYWARLHKLAGGEACLTSKSRYAFFQVSISIEKSCSAIKWHLHWQTFVAELCERVKVALLSLATLVDATQI